MSKTALHQIVVGATLGDAITDQAFLLRRWLREMGFASEIYSQYIHPALLPEVRPVSNYRPRSDERWVIYHYSIGSEVTAQLLGLPVRLILIYHNVTPPEFFDSVDPALARQMREGREQLGALSSRTDLALADSPFNESELLAVGFERTGVLPIVLEQERYHYPVNPDLVARFDNQGPLLLFVGRIAPNKKQEDLIKLLYFYKRIDPTARLLLVGDPWVPAYDQWLREFAHELGLQDSVLFLGQVSQADLVTYYKMADLYVSMSEHEGFGKPLIESMYLELPVMAYAAAGVLSTLNRTGIVFRHKHCEALGELVDLLVNDQELRQRLISNQRDRSQVFLEATVLQTWTEQLQTILSE